MSRVTIAAVTTLFLISSAMNSKAGDPKLLEGDPLKQNEEVLSKDTDHGLMAPEPLATDEEIYQKGKFFLNAGVHLGWYRYGYRGTYNALSSVQPMIPISTSLEFAALDFIGLGGYFGYARRTYEYEHTYTTGSWPQFQTHTENREDRYTYTSFGAKAAFHVIPFLNKTFDFDHNLDGSKYDLYIAHFIGVRVETERTVDEDGSTIGSSNQDTDPIIMNPAIGARYMFTNFFGAYVELGYGHFGGGEAKGGLSLRF